MIKREHYLAKIRPFVSSDLIKVIVGIRRCGKTTVMKQFLQELLDAGTAAFYLNLEDDQVCEKVYDSKTLREWAESLPSSNGQLPYLFIDEVQKIEDFPSALATLRVRGYSVICTGSNSKLLSSELLDVLSGRMVHFRVHPFSYKEAKELSATYGRALTINDFLINGGLPARFAFEGEALSTYFTDVKSSIVIHDLETRYSPYDKERFENVITFLTHHTARDLSYPSMIKELKKGGIDVSRNTLESYVSMAESAYLVNKVRVYDGRAKSDFSRKSKIYVEDLGLSSVDWPLPLPDITRNMETAVYHELRNRGYNPKCYRNRGKEIDFVVFKNGFASYIQVSYRIDSPTTLEREISAFEGLSINSERILITNDEAKLAIPGIRHILLKDFLEGEPV